MAERDSCSPAVDKTDGSVDMVKRRGREGRARRDESQLVVKHRVKGRGWSEGEWSDGLTSLGGESGSGGGGGW